MKNLVMKRNLWLLVALCIVVVGATLFGIFGFNGSVAYSDGYEVQIKTEIDFDKNTDKIDETAKEVFKDNKISYGADYLIYNFDSHTVFAFKKEVSQEVLAELQQEVYNAINPANTTNEIDVIVEQYESTSIDGQKLLPVFLATLGAVIVLGVYLMFRQKFAAAFTVMAVTAIETLILLALTAITRAVVVPAFYAVVIAGVALTLITSIHYTGKAKYSTGKYESLANASKKEVAKNLDCGNIKFNALVAIAVLLVAVALVIFGPALVRWLGLTLALTALSVAFTGAFVTPAIWVTFASIGGKDKYAYKPAEPTGAEK